MGAFGLVQGIRLRSGISRRMLAESYRDTSLPRWKRNGPFALIPLTLGFLLIGIAAIKGQVLPLGVVLGVIAAGLAMGPVTLATMAFPPDWSKPRWLREAEALGWQGYRSESRRGDAIFTAILATTAFTGIGLVIAANFQIAYLLGPLLLGTGAALSFWYGGRRKRGDS
jgi:hypothetical protein